MLPLRIWVIEDNRLIRAGIVALLARNPQFEVVDADRDPAPPDLVLLDPGLRSRNSLEWVKRHHIRYPATRIIVMGLFPTHGELLEFIQAGVSGFILKEATVEDFHTTIRSVMNGDKVLPSYLTDSLFSQIVQEALAVPEGRTAVRGAIRMTRREREVVALVGDGLTNKEIGIRLRISEHTVKSHVHNILEKLTLHSRLQIALYSTENRLD